MELTQAFMKELWACELGGQEESSFHRFLSKQNSVGVSHSHVFALPITVSWASMYRSRQCFKANYSPEENLGREGVWYGKSKIFGNITTFLMSICCQHIFISDASADYENLSEPRILNALDPSQ
ncbi:hypothetical protein Peur_071938 [Populus x canadensis]